MLSPVQALRLSRWQSRWLACCPARLIESGMAFMPSCRQVFLIAVWNAVRLSGFLAILRSIFLKCYRD
ncbi:hypothetical protein [Proteiniphilum saccharofermentans]|uniref:hypothetical protein n=1 Tax=Proteiniphilum saccharofermentans TaxID=1642647 RepID=UPI0028A6ED05|nr:hypothetical protein [Proteiniphilum saccharofermentans]